MLMAAHGLTKEHSKFFQQFIGGSMEKMAWDGPKWGREVFFPASPDLADILGDMDLDSKNLHFLYFVG